MAGTRESSQGNFSITQTNWKKNPWTLRVPEQLFLLFQRVEHVDRGALLQAVGLEGRKHVDELQKDLAYVHCQEIIISLRSNHMRENGQRLAYSHRQVTVVHYCVYKICQYSQTGLSTAVMASDETFPT